MTVIVGIPELRPYAPHVNRRSFALMWIGVKPTPLCCTESNIRSSVDVLCLSSTPTFIHLDGNHLCNAYVHKMIFICLPACRIGSSYTTSYPTSVILYIFAYNSGSTFAVLLAHPSFSRELVYGGLVGLDSSTETGLNRGSRGFIEWPVLGLKLVASQTDSGDYSRM